MLPPKLLYEQLSDAELVQLVQREDADAFAVLYARYWAFLMDVAYRRFQSREKAEDLIQDIFISLYQKRHELSITVSLKAYLSQALKYKILNEFRSENTRNTHHRSIFLNAACKNDFASHLEAKELDKRIHRVLSSLPEKCKKVFFLSRWENQTNKDISSELDISVSTVEKHIGKALKVLRQDLKEYDVSF